MPEFGDVRGSSRERRLRRADQTAAVLAVPEVAWTAFATVLSTAVAAKKS
jgi:hypothetical protein